MNRKLRTLFEERKITGPKSSKIFLNRHGEAYRLATTVFNNAVRRYGIENFHFHDLRHAFASRLAMCRVDLRTIQALMGHKTINMTLRYAHLAPDHLKRAVEVLQGEGRCPVVPLVFKTSLGAVRSPEGSTPSLLRQRRDRDKA